MRLSHDGQVPTCRRCNRRGHQASGCRNTVCFNCDGLGHTARDCVKPMYCCICKSGQHLARSCPFLWYRPVSPRASPTVDLEQDLAMSEDSAENSPAVGNSPVVESPPVIDLVSVSPPPPPPLVVLLLLTPSRFWLRTAYKILQLKIYRVWKLKAIKLLLWKPSSLMLVPRRESWIPKVSLFSPPPPPDQSIPRVEPRVESVEPRGESAESRVESDQPRVESAESRVESPPDESAPPASSVSTNEPSTVPGVSNVPASSVPGESVSESVVNPVPEDRNVSESTSSAVSLTPEVHISTASWAEICDNFPSVHRLPQVANPRPPRTSSLGRRKPAPVVSTAPQRKPTRPSLVGGKKSDESVDMDSQPSSLKRKDPPPDS